MNQDEAKVKIRALRSPFEPEFGELLLNLGLELVACGEDAKIRKNRSEIGQIDFIFEDRELGKIFLIEVSTDASGISEKMDHFFSRWSDQSNMDLIGTQFSLRRTYEMMRTFFQLAGPQELSPSIRHCLTAQNRVLFKYDFDYFSDAFNKVGRWAKNDFLSYLDVKPRALTTTDKPAIQFYLGDDTRAYVYVDSAKALLQYSYIFRRKKDDKGYQRMLEKGRIGSIARKIERSSIFAFPNSILISCPDSPQLCTNPSPKSRCPCSVTIKVPNYYSACRVIDGQHRLLAFANLEERYQEENFMPVVALENIEQHREMQTFIEINSGQKKIDRNLILVLEADFDWEMSKNPKEFFEKQAVLVVKRLNDTDGSPLRSKIFIPEALAKRTGRITLNTLVTAVLGNNFIGRKYGLFQKNHNDTETPYRKIREVFVLAKRQIPRYCKDTGSFLLTNKGLRILFRLVQIHERNRRKRNIDFGIAPFLTDLGQIFTDELVERLEVFYGEGGANRAVEEIFKLLRKQNKKRYQNVITDLRTV
jgi:DGQHR domain-containing protein